jgi:hypothetical protein
MQDKVSQHTGSNEEKPSRSTRTILSYLLLIIHFPTYLYILLCTHARFLSYAYLSNSFDNSLEQREGHIKAYDRPYTSVLSATA